MWNRMEYRALEEFEFAVTLFNYTFAEVAKAPAATKNPEAILTCIAGSAQDLKENFVPLKK